jgi:hypothetical protein
MRSTHIIEKDDDTLFHYYSTLHHMLYLSYCYLMASTDKYLLLILLEYQTVLIA